VSAEKVAVVTGVVNSAVALGVRDLFTESKVPLVISNAGANALTGAKGSPFIWRTSYANAQVDFAIGAHVAKKVGATGGAYLIAADYAAGKEHLAGFKKAFTAAGGKVAGEQYTPFGTTKDYQPYLSAIRKSGAKAVFAFYAGGEAVTFVKQYKEFGLAGSVPLYSAGFLTEGGVLAAQGEAATGIQTSLNYSSELDNPKNAAFVKAYSGKYNAKPTVYAVQSYDAAQVLDKALAATKGGGDGQAIVDALGKVGEIDSPRGKWSFDQTRNPTQTYYLREVRKSGDKNVNAVLEELGTAAEAVGP
jgi:branched-chain amino acid transport system substrate-binding protein